MAIIVLEDDTGYAPRSERYSAIDEDAYDGAPDGCTVRGVGATPALARADLVDAMEDAGTYTAEEAATVRKDYGIGYCDPDHLREALEESLAMLNGLDD